MKKYRAATGPSLQVAHYSGGEYFKTHEDAFPNSVAEKKGYQRRATVLVYLNDVAEVRGHRHLNIKRACHVQNKHTCIFILFVFFQNWCRQICPWFNWPSSEDA